MMSLTSHNYHSLEANRAYWSVSQFKSFSKCEAAGLAEVRGEYKREETDSLLIGSYVDAYFSGDLEEFVDKHADQMFTKKGELYAKYVQAEKMIERIKQDRLMLDYLRGDRQVIIRADLFGYPWKAKIDVLSEDRIVDLKTVKDFGYVNEEGYGRRSWVEAWGYDIQGAVYQKLEQIYSGRPEPLPFYLAAVTKEKVPDIKVIQIPQYVLDTALQIVEAKIDRFDLIKSGEVEPIRCEKCDYCKATKVLTVPEIYETEEDEA